MEANKNFDDLSGFYNLSIPDKVELESAVIGLFTAYDENNEQMEYFIPDVISYKDKIYENKVGEKVFCGRVIVCKRPTYDEFQKLFEAKLRVLGGTKERTVKIELQKLEMLKEYYVTFTILSMWKKYLLEQELESPKIQPIYRNITTDNEAIDFYNEILSSLRLRMNIVDTCLGKDIPIVEAMQVLCLYITNQKAISDELLLLDWSLLKDQIEKKFEYTDNLIQGETLKKGGVVVENGMLRLNEKYTSYDIENQEIFCKITNDIEKITSKLAALNATEPKELPKQLETNLTNDTQRGLLYDLLVDANCKFIIADKNSFIYVFGGKEPKTFVPIHWNFGANALFELLEIITDTVSNENLRRCKAGLFDKRLCRKLCK